MPREWRFVGHSLCRQPLHGAPRPASHRGGNVAAARLPCTRLQCTGSRCRPPSGARQAGLRRPQAVTTCNQIVQYLQPDQTPTTSVLTSGRSRSKGCVVHESRKLALVLRPLAPHSTFVRSESATGTHPSAPAASKRDAMGLDVSWKGWAALATFALQNGLAILLVRYSKLHDRPYSSQVAVLLGLGLGSQVAIDRYMGLRIFSVHRAPVS